MGLTSSQDDTTDGGCAQARVRRAGAKATRCCSSYAAPLKQAHIIKCVEFLAEYIVDFEQLAF